MSIQTELTKRIYDSQRTGRKLTELYLTPREAAELIVSFWNTLRIDAHSPQSLEEMPEILPKKLTPPNTGYRYHGLPVFLEE